MRSPLTAVAAVLTALGLSTTGVAAAAPPTTGHGSHCLARLNHPGIVCFADYRQLVDHLSGGRITDAPTNAHAATADPRVRGALSSPHGDVIVGVFFDDQGYGGQSLTVTGGSPCKDGGDGANWFVEFGDLGWNNRISSLQPWGNCWIRLYAGPHQSSDQDGPYKSDTNYVGPQLDNRAQSAAFE